MAFLITHNHEPYYKVPAIGLAWKQLGLKPFVHTREQKNLPDVAEFYLKEKDFITYSNHMLKESYKKDNNKVVVASLGIQSIILKMKTEGFSEEVYYSYKMVISQIQEINFDVNFKEYMKKLESSPKVKYFLLRAVLCKSIAHKLGWSSKKIQEDILMASLFCDLIEGETNDFHGEELAKIMAKNPKISDGVINGIKHHHEFNDGSGPLKLTRYKINPVAKVIRAVEETFEFIKQKEDLSLMLMKFKSKIDSPILDICIRTFQGIQKN